MKPPRWLVHTSWILVATFLLGFAGWWWVTWPERTARQFFAFVESGHVDQANQMIEATSDLQPDLAASLNLGYTSELNLEARTFGDVVSGHQRFTSLPLPKASLLVGSFR